MRSIKGLFWSRFRLRILTACLLGLVGLAARPCFAADVKRPGPSPALKTADTTPTKHAYTNRLIDSHDSYLLLHAHNPVDWYPWGPQAFAVAKRENKPIFLSVGYSTCYWCHVAEREIYSDPKIAKLMNKWFVNIKVDREQRPDVDRVYMLATRILTGGGGWPNNVFLTPDRKPFFAGSYFSPTDQADRPGFSTILKTLHRAWKDDPAKVNQVGQRVYQAMKQVEQQMAAAGGPAPAPAQWLKENAQRVAAQYDARNRGFGGGGSTMFPNEPLLSMLLADYQQDHTQRSLDMVTATLTAMAEGGVMDQLAGGFHRYSIDPQWNIPHFEKMLDDNAQLLGIYARAYQMTKQPLFKQVALRTAHYLVTEMHDPRGGFYNAQDAQVDGVEGASYVWTRKQIESVLGTAGAKRFFAMYTLTSMPQGRGGQTPSPGGVLRLDRQKADRLAAQHTLASRLDALAPLRGKLLAARNQRPQPARDETIVTAGNALAILGFLQAGQALHAPALTRVAIDTATWEWTHAYDEKSGILRHQFFQGHAGDSGFLDDYALLGQAFLAVHRVTGEAVWRRRAQQLADAMLNRFERPDGQLASTTDAGDLLITPPVEGDLVRPSGPSAAVALLLGLAADGGDTRYAQAVRRELTPLSAPIQAEPYNWGAMVANVSRPRFIALLKEGGAMPQAVAGLPNSANHVHARAYLDSAGVVHVTVVIDDGYHINANPASDANLIPTTLTVASLSKLKVDYPSAQTFKAPFARKGVAVYTKRVELLAHLPHASASPVQVKLRVQACNDQSCLAPATITLTAKPPSAGETKPGK